MNLAEFLGILFLTFIVYKWIQLLRGIKKKKAKKTGEIDRKQEKKNKEMLEKLEEQKTEFNRIKKIFKDTLGFDLYYLTALFLITAACFIYLLTRILWNFASALTRSFS